MMVGAEPAGLFHAPLGCSSKRRFREEVSRQRVGGHGDDRVSLSATELRKPPLTLDNYGLAEERGRGCTPYLSQYLRAFILTL